MPLESCMILLDCTEYMRNGDYVPNRLEAQKDAANLLVGAKTQSHPESTVGISAGTELLVSPTNDVGKILSAIHGLQYSKNKSYDSSSSAATAATSVSSSSAANITAAVQVASLALKHRRNKHGSQRIVLFVGSPLEEVETRALQKAGRQLKKNNICIDVVALGELEENEAKLRELVDAANGISTSNSSAGIDGEQQQRTCHLVTIPAGGGVLVSDVLASSPIIGSGAFAASAAAASMNMGAGGMAQGGGMEGGGGGGGGDLFSEYGGVDPNLDPELAMALRVSMEEERLRQERMAAAAATAASSESKEDEAMMHDDQDSTTAAATAAAMMEAGLSEEEALLQQALAMSMNENEPSPSTEQDENAKKPPVSAEDVEMEDGGEDDDDTIELDDVDEDAAMQMALQMSMQQQEPAAAASSEFQDPSFVSELLGSMPGVDPNDPDIQEALRKAQEKKQKEEDKKQKK